MDRYNATLSCGSCPSGYTCSNVTDLGVHGLKCISSCTGGASCNNPDLPDYEKFTHCDPSVSNNNQLRRNHIYNGVIFGLCSGPESMKCDSFLPDAYGNVNFECINTAQTTYATSTPLWISGAVCIRPLCKSMKRIVCTGNPAVGPGVQCWTQKTVLNTANECQWADCAKYAGTAADRALDNSYCYGPAALL